MRIYLTVLIATLCSICAHGQYKVEGTLTGVLHTNVLLLEYFGDEHRIADSVRTDGNGWFTFEMSSSSPTGLYSLAIGKNPLFNFIFNKEDVVLKYDPSGYGAPEFIHSAENLIYYDYLVQEDRYIQKTSMLLDIFQYYPVKDSFRLYSEAHYYNLQMDFRAYTDRILDEYPGTLAAHIVKSDRPVTLPPGFEWDRYIEFNRAHYFDETDFSDTLLLNTNVFTSKSIDYLSYYSINNQNKELQEQFFIQAVDTILHKAMEDGKVFDFLMKYLIDGFEMYGFDRVISHIAANYEPASSCVNEERKSELEKRVENLRKLAVGNVAPEIVAVNASGEEFYFELDHEYTVLLFWASWCPHCNDMLPRLKELYLQDAQTGFEVIAVSIDTSAVDYNAALAHHSTPWINYTDLKGWDSRVAVDYSIYATPTMFLLDRQRKIIARPVSVSDLRYELDKLK